MSGLVRLYSYFSIIFVGHYIWSTERLYWMHELEVFYDQKAIIFIFFTNNIYIYFFIRMHVNSTNALSCDSGTEDCGSCLSLPVPSLKHLLLIKMLDLPGEQKLKTKHKMQTDTRLPPFVVDKQIPWSRKCTSNGLRLGFLHCLSLC